MFNYFRYTLLFFIVLLMSFNAIAQAAMPDNTCVGALKHYNVESNSIPGSTYIWRIDGIVQPNFTTNEIDITWNTSGSYLLDVRETTEAGCTGPLKSGQVFVNTVPEISANSNSPVCEGSPINLTAETISGGSYSWTGPDNYSSSVQNPEIVSASQLNAGDYLVTVSTNGCTSEPYDVAVIVNNCWSFFIPEGFSPNGDGTNDLFVIRGIEHYPNNTFVIFNRWGDKVFEMNHYQNTWNGSSTLGLRIGGNELPVGTYFYILDLGDSTPVYKGTIYLDR